MMRGRFALRVALLLAVLLAGCGQTGALFLPEPPPPRPAPAPGDAAGDTAGEDTTTEDDDEETPAG